MMSYAYDALNRMSSSQPIGGTATAYAYDANSQRYSKTTGSKTTISVWSNGGIFYDDILSSSGTTQSSSQYLPGNMGVVKDGVLYSNAVDGKGDVAATLTNNTGDITDYNFDAYGNKATSVALASPYGYRGYYQDSETGFYYLNARYYDPGTRQFTQEDTYAGDIQDPMSLNLYGYCQANPVRYTDPTGHWVNSGGNNWKAEKGDTLWGLAVKLTGDGSNWRKIGFSRDPHTLQIGEVVNVNGMIGTPTPTPAPTPTPSGRFSVGDRAIVDGFGTADSYGEGSKTQIFHNHTLTVAAITSSSNGRTHIYGLSQNGKTGTANVIGWFSDDELSSSTDTSVRYNVPIFNQGGLSLCWAYSQVMIEDFRAGGHMTQAQADTRAQQIAMSVFGRNNWNQGYWPTNIGDGVAVNIYDLYNALVAYGPLYAWYGVPGGHYIVVTGVNLTTGMVYTNNPWGIYGVQTYNEFVNGFAGMPSDWPMSGVAVYIAN